MKKFNVNPNLAAVILMAGLFAGWTYLIFAIIFVALVEENEYIKEILIKTVTLSVACLLFSTAWDLITLAVDAVESSIYGIYNMIYSIDNTVMMPEFITIIFEGIVDNAVDVVSKVVSLLVLFTKFGFVISVIANKPFKTPFGKINEYLTHLVNYVYNRVNPQTMAQQPVNNQMN